MTKQDRFEHSYICSDKGSYRQRNEDNFVLNEIKMSTDLNRYDERAELSVGWNVFGVLDGMGGTIKGDEASVLAASEFVKISKVLSGISRRIDLDNVVRNAFLVANNSIVRFAKYSGTTATIIISDGRFFKLYHIGDSRALLIRNGYILQLTKDQTVAEMKRDMGLYDSIVETDKHKLTEYLGADESMRGISPQESKWFSYSEGDHLILCTDGLYEGCSLQEIQLIVNNTEPRQVASSLVDLALSRSIRDNVTCMYIC